MLAAMPSPVPRQDARTVDGPSIRVLPHRAPGDHPICVMDYRYSAFCWTRLQAASQIGPVLGLEMSSDFRAYAWEKIERKGDFTRVTLFPEGEADDAPVAEMLTRLNCTLDEHRPAAVAVVGWAFKWSLGALAWCLRNNVPAILLSDSTAISNERVWYKELIKRRLVRLYSSAIVAGSPQRDYVASLGMPVSRIFPGWDIVDNDYFATGARRARANIAEVRRKRELPENYFLSINRFVEVKNLRRLMLAYQQYRSAAGPAAWKLVLAGDGPLMPDVLRWRTELALEQDVLLPGFKQYPDLPEFYGPARAFILASTSETWGLVVNEAMASGLPVLISNRCGCAHDLVAEGRNGFSFDPLDTDGLARCMLRLSGPESDLRAMGETSSDIISRWSPEIWAQSLQLASDVAMASPRPASNTVDHALIHHLIHR